MARDLCRLPKAHLHLHLEGSARATTMAEFATQLGVERPIRRRFDSFGAFDAHFFEVWSLVQTPDDLARICRELVEDEAVQGVRYIEPMIGPQLYEERFGWPADEVLHLIHQEMTVAGARCGVAVGLMVGAIRTWPVERIDAVARFAAANTDYGVVAFGIAGEERPDEDIGRFAGACASARAAGLCVVPHAGELAGQPLVQATLDLLQPDRIAHGVRAAESATLMRRLADAGVVCDLCLSSNVALGVVPSLDAHPLPKFLAAGVPVTVGADDQLFFGAGILDEYRALRSVFGLSDHEIATIARTSAEASNAPADVRRAMMADIHSWLAY